MGFWVHAADETKELISGNPAAVNFYPGTGELGEWVGIPEAWGLRIGGVGIVDFGNVLKSIPVSNPGPYAPSLSGLIFTPIFTNPTMLGVLPGHCDSAYGVTVSLSPIKQFHVNWASMIPTRCPSTAMLAWASPRSA